MVEVPDTVGNGVSFSLVIVAMALLATTGTAAAQSAPDCSTVSYSGDGTTSSPYEVSNVDQLQCINEQGLDANYVQVSDIDASETSSWNGGEGFVPIANDTDDSSANFQGTKFRGTFDGSGHTISGLYIDRGSTVGMFGYVGSGGRIEKVGVENVNITGNVGVGGLVGRNSGTVENSYATGSVSSDGFNVGGLVGDGRLGTVKKSYATGDVSGDSNVGGLVGNGGTVEKSYATGSVSGGRNVGGLVGQDAALTVTGSYYDTETTGQSSSEGGTGLTTSEMTGSAATSNMDAFDFTSTWETESDDYPILTWQTDGNGNTIDSASNGDGERNGGTDGGNVGSNGADGENTAENSSGTEGSEGLPGFTVVTAAIALLTVAAAAVRRRME
jgi:hypothetical protein